jgi:hypothetical protein
VVHADIFPDDIDSVVADLHAGRCHRLGGKEASSEQRSCVLAYGIFADRMDAIAEAKRISPYSGNAKTCHL